MPVHLAMPLYLSNEDFENRKTLKLKRPLRPCLQPEVSESLKGNSNSKAKKQVSFADHKGLALTMVKIFSEFDDPIGVPLSIQELFCSAFAISEEEDKLVLDFPQPSADYLHFRQRLEEDLVCLENCMLKDRAVTGTIKVKNVSFEKAVKVRITFDTWKTFSDIHCEFVKDTYEGSVWDTFIFEADLPEQVPPHERVEFAVFYLVDGVTHWDSNQGQNYRIIHSSLKKSSFDSISGHQRYGIIDWDAHFDRFGSPRCSHGIFAEWPSYAGYEDLGPYY